MSFQKNDNRLRFSVSGVVIGDFWLYYKTCHALVYHLLFFRILFLPKHTHFSIGFIC
jgi:hypothetical protein